MNKKKFENIYCTFLLNQTEMAIPVEGVQEVINIPAVINPMPLAPPFLIGVFNLRNMIIPLVDLGALLSLRDEISISEKKVAIVDYEGARIGLLFNATGEILRIHEEEKCDFNYTESTPYKVIKGVIRLSGERIIQVMDVNALFTIENIPHVIDYQKNIMAKMRQASKHSSQKKCITFNIGNVNFAIDMNGIFEVVKIEKIQTSALVSDICNGYIHLRSLVVPLINFSKILGLNQQSELSVIDQKVIVIKLEGEFFGLLVDSVNSINPYSDEEIMPVPLLSKERAVMFKGCVQIEDKGDVLFLDQTKILTNDEILAITHGHSKLYQDKEALNEQESMKKKSGLREVFITFRSNFLFAFGVKEVKEIINYSTEIFEAPGLPYFVIGMLNLRGSLVTVINLKKMYGMNETHEVELDKCKIMVMSYEGDLVGLLVDQVDSLVSIDLSAKMQLPDLLFKNSYGQFRTDIKEVLEYSNENGKSSGVIVLDKEKVFFKIKKELSQDSSLNEQEKVLEQVP